MLRLSGTAAAAVMAICVMSASAQIIPESGAPESDPVVTPGEPAPAEPDAPPPAVPPPASAPELRTSFSNADLAEAFRATGLSVTEKTAPNGLIYLEGKSGGDLIFGAGLKCAGEGATGCKVLMLQSGTLNKAVPYADMMKFTTSGFSARAVTFDPKTKYPALLQMTHIYGSFDGTLLSGSIKGLMSDMQAFLTMLQGGRVQAYSAGIPEARAAGAFSGNAFEAAVAVQLQAGAN